MGLFKIKRRDTLPVLEVTLRDPELEDGTIPAHNLTGASGVKLHLRKLTGGSVITRDMVIDGDPTSGIVTYAWQAADWDVLAAGAYVMEYEALGPSSARLTFPNDENDLLHVTDDIGQG